MKIPAFLTCQAVLHCGIANPCDAVFIPTARGDLRWILEESSWGKERLTGLEFVQGPRITSEGVRLDTEVLEHCNKEVAQRFIGITLEG